MPASARVNGSDSPTSGRARQRLKLSALGYNAARHGIDTDAELARAGLRFLCRMAIEYGASIPGAHLKGRRIDLYLQGDSVPLQLAAIAYSSARHGVDADVGMAREGLALLCQASLDYCESLPKEDLSKRAGEPHLQLGNGA